MTQPQRVLGLVLSLRRGGNSEVLTRTALQAAAAAGAQTDILFFKDLTVKWCDGCLSCVFGGEGCHKDDHAVWLYELVAGYDGLVVAAPTYLLTPAAPVKALIDRAVALGARDGRRAVVRTATIAVAGLRGWEHLAAPVLNQLAIRSRPTLPGRARLSWTTTSSRGWASSGAQWPERAGLRRPRGFARSATWSGGRKRSGSGPARFAATTPGGPRPPPASKPRA